MVIILNSDGYYTQLRWLYFEINHIFIVMYIKKTIKGE